MLLKQVLETAFVNLSDPPGPYPNLARQNLNLFVVDRAGFEPAALRSRVSAFPHSGSRMTCQAGDLRPALTRCVPG